ncbi:MAG: toxin [Nitrospinae bacterium]|nr:toxin [Nitrospinota bacterium]
MKPFYWNEEKNNWLKQYRTISFEEIVDFIENDGLIDTFEHPNQKKYVGQDVFVVKTDKYVYLLFYVEEETYYFLKTIIPNRAAKKKYMEKTNG